ncbi:MAG: type II secretion system protein GspE [Planctomycetes bacterium]|nr:type II secretion system protein GspE [Planctomycetota bacterium]
MDIGEHLLAAGVIRAEQLAEARAVGGESLCTVLIDKRMVAEKDLVQAIAKRFSLEAANLEGLTLDREILKTFPEALSKSTGTLPLRREGALLIVATSDPANEPMQDRIARATGCSVRFTIAGPKAIIAARTTLYAKQSTKAAASAIPGPALKELDQILKRAAEEAAPTPEVPDADPRNLPKLEIRELDAPVVRLVHGLLLKALRMRASDIHIEPMEDSLRVRFRVDGEMQEVIRLAKDMRATLSSCIKIMSSMDIAERRVPQDGGIKLALDEKNAVDFRVSSLPGIHGEKIVMRVLGTGDLKGSVDELGLEGRALELVREAIANPCGMILVTGPTGSGKTTTLYTILSQLNQPNVNIVTAEDPVEYTLAGLTQVHVRHQTGLTFEVALRSFLRQDPDIILVGEMRDYETASIAVKAALTGHLVLSTLHTNDAPSTVVRLVDMGIEPYLVASAVKLVVAQRLVRRICVNCREDVDLAALQRSDLDQSILSSVERLSRGRGCEQCGGSGYRGRNPVFEVMAVKSKEMKRAITEGGTEVQVGQIGKREGMHTLTDCAIELVNRGITTLEEARGIILAE